MTVNGEKEWDHNPYRIKTFQRALKFLIGVYSFSRACKSQGWSQHAVVTSGKAEHDFRDTFLSHVPCILILKSHLDITQLSRALHLETASRVKDIDLWHVEEINGDHKNLKKDRHGVHWIQKFPHNVLQLWLEVMPPETGHKNPTDVFPHRDLFQLGCNQKKRKIKGKHKAYSTEKMKEWQESYEVLLLLISSELVCLL